MRLFALLVLVGGLVCAASEKTSCTLGDFHYLALSTHDPQERKQRLLGWVIKSGPACSKAELTTLYSNLPWLIGTADDGEIKAVLEQLYRKAPNEGSTLVCGDGDGHGDSVRCDPVADRGNDARLVFQGH